VYEITLPGTLTTLFRFDYTDGAYPSAGLVQATNGELYGTTTVGSGAVFEITQKAQLSTLATLNSTADGIAPNGVIQAASGDFYGTTSQGGPGGAGAVFRVTPSGVVSNLYSFGDAEDGGFPSASLVEDINGDFYGTTIDAGASGDGTIFRITPSGALTTVYNFCSEPNCTDGAYTEAALIQTANGDLYGTTQAGGVYDYGTVLG
jgi:uncharacterized repeat protein (TIGR03803 family)